MEKDNGVRVALVRGSSAAAATFHSHPTPPPATLSFPVTFMTDPPQEGSLRAAAAPTPDLKALIREIPDFPKPGILFYDITTLLKEPQGLRSVIDALKDH